ncbi:hypothetical protein M422DRAFT_150486, partial [Sphaerobolus stellatus SS14]
AMCMLLSRLAWPSRLCNVEMQFGWERSRFSQITHITASFLLQQWKHLLHFNPTHLTREKLSSFAQAINSKGAPINCIAALIDGTLQKNARPVQNRCLVYNGWKQMHCLKYHAVIAPDGLIIHMYGPVDGRRHDETVYKESGLAELLDKHFWTPNDDALFIYRDPAYTTAAHVSYQRSSSFLTGASL